MAVVAKIFAMLVGATLLGGLSMPSHAVDTRYDSDEPTLGDAQALIRAEKWVEAVALLKTVVAGNTNNADANNLLGYALRKSGDYSNAEGFYLKALTLKPDHKGAHEYLGELYVEIGQIGKAEDLLLRLEQICGNTQCEEYRTLAAFIAANG